MFCHVESLFESVKLCIENTTTRHSLFEITIFCTIIRVSRSVYEMLQYNHIESLFENVKLCIKTTTTRHSLFEIDTFWKYRVLVTMYVELLQYTQVWLH